MPIFAVLGQESVGVELVGLVPKIRVSVGVVEVDHDVRVGGNERVFWNVFKLTAF